MPTTFPSRREYLLEQKEKGRRLLGVFPGRYPREILWALNILPVEIWDPPLELRAADAHLQAYVCPLVKLGLELLLQGKAEMLDGFLFPHTCDSIQNLASLVRDYLGLDKPCFFLNHPRSPHGHSGRRYYRRALQALALDLAREFGPLHTDELERRVDQGRKITYLVAKLYYQRCRENQALDNRQFYATLRRAEWLHPDDFQAHLEQVLALPPGPAPAGPNLILSGVLASPDLLATLDRLGVRVVHDDLLNTGRRWSVALRRWERGDDPWAELGKSYFLLAPCSTRTDSLESRLAHILGLVDFTQAAGVIFQVVKFCEPELFDLPPLMQGLKERGIPVLSLETELRPGGGGQTATRVEAFVEMIQ